MPSTPSIHRRCKSLDYKILISPKKKKNTTRNKVVFSFALQERPRGEEISRKRHRLYAENLASEILCSYYRIIFKLKSPYI